MKRFVTYLYLYDGRIKGNNAGFIKVEINGEKSAFLVQIKNLGKYSGKGKVYLVYEAEAVIEAGELTVKNGEAREIYNVDTENVKDSGKTFLQVLGVRIELENADEKFLASCWTDNTEAVIGKPIKVQADLSNKETPVSTPKPEPGCQKEIHSQNVDDSQDKIRRIDISELRTLPAKNWYIVNNSFLTHGYANYKHLVIKTDTDGRQYLGVPGVSEPQERMLAGIFGFTEFEPAAPANAADVDSGVFGYWFCPL